MRLLCDQHVPPKYLSAFANAKDVTATTVRDKLAADASDTDIATYAAEREWVVFTNDDDFYRSATVYGLLVYDQISDPSPDEILDAVRAIEAAYDDPTAINRDRRLGASHQVVGPAQTIRRA